MFLRSAGFVLIGAAFCLAGQAPDPAVGQRAPARSDAPAWRFPAPNVFRGAWQGDRAVNTQKPCSIPLTRVPLGKTSRMPTIRPPEPLRKPLVDVPAPPCDEPASAVAGAKP
jgi:hypothetical protein